ncbi:hypothetical protein Ahy_B05g074237 isoform A [Arachis hypogaea]|uniref:Uncharacterized protein n=1 Tax=Arachis hypogaea TaxID=3818 RepID=A0A444YYA8_ARAHY|nr:hypothetical protein Ahy_B05g074237 isoform A [Arachis hypogaea]
MSKSHDSRFKGLNQCRKSTKLRLLKKAKMKETHTKSYSDTKGEEKRREELLRINKLQTSICKTDGEDRIYLCCQITSFCGL